MIGQTDPHRRDAEPADPAAKPLMLPETSVPVGQHDHRLFRSGGGKIARMREIVGRMRRLDRRRELEQIALQPEIPWYLVAEKLIARFQNHPVEIAQILA